MSCKRADLVVVPTRPSPHDLRAVGPTVDIADTLNKPLVFVVNSATARARITSETAVALSQHGVVAPVTLHHRVDFAASMIDGRTVGDIQPESQVRRSKSPQLWMYLRGRLAKLYGGTDARWAEKAACRLLDRCAHPRRHRCCPLHGRATDDDEDWDADLPAWANLAVANATGRGAPGSLRRASDQPRGSASSDSSQDRLLAVLTEPPERIATSSSAGRSDRGPPSRPA